MLHDHQEERPVPVKPPELCFLHHDHQGGKRSQQVGRRLGIHEPFYPERCGSDIAPEQGSAKQYHQQAVKNRKKTVGLEHQQPRNIGSEIQDEGNKKLVKGQHTKELKLVGVVFPYCNEECYSKVKESQEEFH